MSEQTLSHRTFMIAGARSRVLLRAAVQPWWPSAGPEPQQQRSCMAPYGWLLGELRPLVSGTRAAEATKSLTTGASVPRHPLLPYKAIPPGASNMVVRNQMYASIWLCVKLCCDEGHMACTLPDINTRTATAHSGAGTTLRRTTPTPP